MNPELEEYIRQIELRKEVLSRNLNITVFPRIMEFAEAAIKNIGYISVDECKNAIKRVFCEEVDKLK